MTTRHHLLTASVLLVVLFGDTTMAGVLDRLDKIGGLGPAREFLDPEVAFRFSHTLVGQAIILDWDIEPGYYLYRDKVAAKALTAGAQIGTLEKPPGQMKNDPEFGNVAIYKAHAEVTVPVSINPLTTPSANVQITYQGCAEDGICYPPIKKSIELLASAFAGPAAGAPAAEPSANYNPNLLSADEIAARLGGLSLLGVASTFYVFGLLLAFTPCVFPMVPILSGIIVGQRQPVSVGRGLLLSAVYVLAVAATYALVGLVAGRFGHNLQATFQQPAVLIAFALVFVVLAMSMFGFYELQLPAKLQTRLDQVSRSQNGGSLTGVAVMGVLSAIIVGPCVAPPLAGALIYLGHQGSALVGGSALFAMGLGMGTPLLLVGASAGKLLPSAGPWMDVVKQVFGVMLLGVAIWFLERILPGPVTLALWASLIMVSAIYMGALDNLAAGERWPRLFKGLGLAMLCYGAVLIVGASAGANDPLRPLKPLLIGGQTPHPTLSFTPVKGIDGLNAALLRAREQGQPAMLDFYADWCVECKYLERDTFEHQSVVAALSNTVVLRADVTANDSEDRALLKRFELFGPPAVLFFDTGGKERRDHRILGFVGPVDFSTHLASFQ